MLAYLDIGNLWMILYGTPQKPSMKNLFSYYMIKFSGGCL